MSQYAWSFGDPPKYNLNCANGCYLWIDNDKTPFFDLTAGGTHFAVLGHNHPIIKERLIDQFSHSSHFDIKTVKHREIETLASLVISKSHLKEKDYVFYLPGLNGADGIEAALRLSFQSHWSNGFTSKKWVISRKQSYHGMSADALAISDRANLNSQKVTLSSYRYQIEQHNPAYGCYYGKTSEEYLNESLSQLKEAIEKLGAENVAAFVGETILGGLIGDVPPVESYWKEVQRICKESNVHLILDEVYCGTGSSGTYHCCEHDDIEPDFIVLGKTLSAGIVPLSGLILRKSIYKEAISKDGRLAHSTTYQGHIWGVQAAIAAQTILSDLSFIKEVNRKGDFLRSTISAKLSANELYVGIRGRGLRNSLEFSAVDRNRFAEELHTALMQRNIFNICKWHRLSITPPLIITDGELEYLTQAICECFEAISKNHKPAQIAYEWLQDPTPVR